MRSRRCQVKSDIEAAREENMRLRRVQGDLVVRLAEAVATEMVLRGEIERLQRELEQAKASKH